METTPACKKCGSGPSQQVIDSWGTMGDYVFFTCDCGSEIYLPRPLSSCEEGNWPDLLDLQRHSSPESGKA